MPVVHRMPALACRQPRTLWPPMMGCVMAQRIRKVARRDAKGHCKSRPKRRPCPCGEEHQDDDERCAHHRGRTDESGRPLVMRGVPTPERLDAVQDEAMYRVFDERPRA